MQMTPRRPRVGLTTYYKEAAWGDWRRPVALVPATYVGAVQRAGGTPLLLPPIGDDTGVLEALDALILIGGADLDPAHYHQDQHPLTRPEPARDAYELALLHMALPRGMPLLAICRGVQVLNVALGGTLHQHVPDVVPGSSRESGGTVYQPAPGRFGEVDVHTEPGSRIAAALGESATVPRYHHQAVDEVAPGLAVTARSADGLVQALEPAGPAWVLGVQFHPEEDPADGRLFDALVRAAQHRITDPAPDRPQEAQYR